MNFLKTFWEKLNSDVSKLWDESKVFLLVFGIVIFLLKFKDVLISILVSSGKATFDKATTQSDSLLKEETKSNDEANKLIEHSKNIPKEKVDEDWFKK